MVDVVDVDDVHSAPESDDERESRGRLAHHPEREGLSPFALDEYYEDAFCVALDRGMSTCCC